MPHSIPSEILFKQIPMGSMDNFVYLIGDSGLETSLCGRPLLGW